MRDTHDIIGQTEKRQKAGLMEDMNEASIKFHVHVKDNNS